MRAIEIGALTYGSLRSILDHKLDRHTAHQRAADGAPIIHSNIAAREGLQSGIVDVGIYCICHEGQKLALGNFPMYLPFGPADASTSVASTAGSTRKFPS
jgi:hypothetical protein